MIFWERSLIAPEMTFRGVLERIGKHGVLIALVVGAQRRLLGTITDGDLRRAVLAGVAMDRPVTEIMNPKPITIGPDTDRHTQVRILRQNSIRQLPVVDSEHRVVDLIRLDDLVAVEDLQRDNIVVILAGGVGSRLKPLTNQTPKSLLPIGGRPILEIIVSQLAEAGFHRFYFAVNHLADAIKSHFADGKALGVDIRYLNEQAALGTAGALGLITEKLSQPIVVMNSDLLTKIDYASLIEYHVSHNARVTVAMREVEMHLPYGVLNLDGERIVAITEKPTQKHFVNAGIYVVDPGVAKRLTGTDRVDMPDLINDIIAEGGAVAGYPVHEYWIDIGRLEDLQRAADDYSVVFT